MRSPLTCACCLLVLASCEIPPTGRATPPIIGGARSTDATVVAVISAHPNGALQLCSGAIVAPTLVLTAKHCVFEDEGGEAWVALGSDALSVVLGGGVDEVTEELDVLAVTTTDGPYHDGDGPRGGDLAVLTLASPTRIAPARVSDLAPSEGLAVRIVGFGATEPASFGTLGERFEGTANVVSLTDGTFTTEGVSWTCAGDSGGPAFRVDDGTLVGVTSAGPSGCPPSASIYTRLDANVALLRAAGVPIEERPTDAGSVSDAASSDDASVGSQVPVDEGGCSSLAGARSNEAALAWTVGIAWLVWRGRRRG